MHEIINLSLSTHANHLNTQFYNTQQTYFVFDDKQVSKSYVDPSVRFRPDQAFSPRAAFWDFARGGFGNLKKYSGVYDEGSFKEPSVGEDFKIEKILTQNTSSNDTKSQDTEPKKNAYWTEYLRPNVHPTSLIGIPRWEYDPVSYPLGKQMGNDDSEGDTGNKSRPFCGYELGQETWKQASREEVGGSIRSGDDDSEYLDEHLRRTFEQCDLLSGISTATNVDSAWAGFTACLLEGVRDHYAPKAEIHLWAIQNNETQRISRQLQIDRVESVVSLVDKSDLYIPLVVPKFSEQNLPFDPVFFSSSLFNTVYEPYSVVSALRNTPRVSMSDLTNMLNEGTNRKVADCSFVIRTSKTKSSNSLQNKIIDLSWDSFPATSIFPSNTRDSRKRSHGTHLFSKTGIIRTGKFYQSTNSDTQVNRPTSAPASQNPWDAIFAADVAGASANISTWDKYFDEKKLKDNNEGTTMHRISCPQPLSLPVSMPEQVIDESCELLSVMSSSNSSCRIFKAMDNLVYRIGTGGGATGVKRVDNREELREDLGKLCQEHFFGSELSDVSDDDDL